MGTEHVGMRSADQISTVRNSCLRSLTGRNGSVMKGNALKVRGLGRLLRYKDQHKDPPKRAALNRQNVSWSAAKGTQGRCLGFTQKGTQ